MNNQNNSNSSNSNDSYNPDYTDYRSYKKKKVYHDISGGLTPNSNSGGGNQNQYMTQSQQQRYQQYNQNQGYYNNPQQYSQNQGYYNNSQQQSYNQNQNYYIQQQQQQQQQQVVFRNIKNNSLYNEILDQIKFTDDDLAKSVNIWLELFNQDINKSEQDLKQLIQQAYPFVNKTLLDNVISTFCIYRPEYISLIIEILVSQIYNNSIEYKFSLPPFYSFKKLFLINDSNSSSNNNSNNNNNNNQDDNTSNNSNNFSNNYYNNKYNKYQQKLQQQQQQQQTQQQQPIMNFQYGIGGGLVTPTQSLYTINRVIQLQDNNYIPLKILLELTNYNLYYFLNKPSSTSSSSSSSSSPSSSSSSSPSSSSSSSSTSTTKQQQEKRKKSNEDSYLRISIWILDCLIRSPISIIESYFFKLLNIHKHPIEINTKKPFKTLIKLLEQKQQSFSNQELKSKLPISIRNHIISLFQDGLLSIDSKKVQYILHSLVPILVKYQSEFISKDYNFIIIHYFSNTNSSFIHRLIHNLISSSPNTELNSNNNTILKLLEFLMNNKFENLNLQNHFLPPILQGLNEQLIKNNSKSILTFIINSKKFNKILFGKNYSIQSSSSSSSKQQQQNNKNNNDDDDYDEEYDEKVLLNSGKINGYGINCLIEFSSTQNLNGSKILVSLLNYLKNSSSETQNLFFSLWEEYLKQNISKCFNVCSQFWYIKQLVLHYNLFDFELKEMSKRLLLSYLSTLVQQNNQFDSNVLSIFKQLTFNLFYISSLIFKDFPYNNSIIKKINLSSTSKTKDDSLISIMDPSIPIFIDYLQFIIKKFSKDHLIYKEILKTIQQIINNITLLDSTILLKNQQIKSSISNNTATKRINEQYQNIDTTTLEISNIQISLEFLYSLITNNNFVQDNSIVGNISANSDQDFNQSSDNLIIFNNIKEFLLNIMINNNNIRDNIISLLVLNDINFKTISLKLLLEIEKNKQQQQQQNDDNIIDIEQDNYWSSQEKIELLFTNLLDPNLFQLCLEFLQIIKSSNYELIVASLLQKLAILSESIINENLSNAIITLLEELIIKDSQLIYQILKFIQSNLFNHYSQNIHLINNNNNNNNNNLNIFNNNNNNNDNQNYINRNLLILLQKLQILIQSFKNNDNSNNTKHNNYNELIENLISLSLKNIPNNDNNYSIQLLQYQLISNIIFNHNNQSLSTITNDDEYHLNFYNQYIYFLIQGILSSHFSVRILCQTIIQEFINQNPSKNKKKVLDFLIYKLKSFSINSEYNDQIPLLRKSIESIQISSLLQYNNQ